MFQKAICGDGYEHSRFEENQISSAPEFQLSARRMRCIKEIIPLEPDTRDKLGSSKPWQTITYVCIFIFIYMYSMSVCVCTVRRFLLRSRTQAESDAPPVKSDRYIMHKFAPRLRCLENILRCMDSAVFQTNKIH
jgi:hypothetical protein